MAFQRQSKDEFDHLADINVTPLVDVCLVLLIIFMVVSEKLARGKEVPLPKTQYHREMPDNNEQLIISVASEGGKTRIYWDRDAMNDLPDFKRRLDEELRRKAKPFFFKADSGLRYKDVFPVLMAIHDAGVDTISLGTEEKKEGQ